VVNPSVTIPARLTTYSYKAPPFPHQPVPIDLLVVIDRAVSPPACCRATAGLWQRFPSTSGFPGDPRVSCVPHLCDANMEEETTWRKSTNEAM
jgi:hypothetical protein